MSTANGNGSTKLHWWLISALTGVVLGVGSHQLTGESRHAERIAVLEEQQRSTTRQLQRIEQKLDRALDHRHP
jgi:hypothetical protein